MRQTITKCSKMKPGEENTHESCAKTRQSSHKNSMWSMPSWMNSVEKSAFIAVFYWLVNDPPVMNTLTPYLI